MLLNENRFYKNKNLCADYEDISKEFTSLIGGYCKTAYYIDLLNAYVELMNRYIKLSSYGTE